MSIFDQYKPFRNKLRQLGVIDSLYVIWAYSQWLQRKDYLIPGDIETRPEIAQRHPSAKRWFGQWELEVITKEILINSGNIGNRSLRKWPVFADILNNLKELENHIADACSNSDNVLVELVRIAHRQFIWQGRPLSSIRFMRYLEIFSGPDLDEICYQKLGIHVRDIYACCLLFTGHFSSELSWKLPIKSRLKHFPEQTIKRFLDFASKDRDELRTLLLTEQVYSDAFVYAFTSLRTYPILAVTHEDKQLLFCPMPILLFWRATSGLYYELVTEKGFSQPFGKSFQRYVGDVASRANKSGRIQLFEEREYPVKGDRKDSVDWILAEPNCALFLECKAKRLSFESKMALTDLAPLKRDIEYLGRAVVQSYKTIRDYRDNKYPHLTFNQSRKIYPVIITLENWYLFSPLMKRMLHEAVLGMLESEQISLEWMNDMPYSIWSVEEAENCLQIIDSMTIADFMQRKLDDPETRDWEWQAFIDKELLKKYPARNLFQAEYDGFLREIASQS